MNLSDRKGFTLIEVVMALAIFSIGILTAFMLNGTIIKGNSGASRVSVSTSWGEDRVEKILSMAYDSDNNGKDDDGDGSTDEADEFVRDGAGTDAVQAGLDNVPPKKAGDPVKVADNSVNSPDGEYTVYWNVAENYPEANMKTVRVIVRNRQLNIDSKFTTVKISNI